VKTISVSETAYERLAVWKKSRKDTFSKVIERMVPAKGTFDAVLEATENLPDLSDEQVDSLESAVNEGRKTLDDPWK
jgi:predicted CopG family antitoxin